MATFPDVSRAKTPAAAKVAADAVFQCRIIAARADAGAALDKALYDFEHAFFRRADELTRAKKNPKKRKRAKR